jgi:hypothetical protein
MSLALAWVSVDIQVHDKEVPLFPIGRQDVILYVTRPPGYALLCIHPDERDSVTRLEWP